MIFFSKKYTFENQTLVVVSLSGTGGSLGPCLSQGSVVPAARGHVSEMTELADPLVQPMVGPHTCVSFPVTCLHYW
jgi:hypothetical protein